MTKEAFRSAVKRLHPDMNGGSNRWRGALEVVLRHKPSDADYNKCRCGTIIQWHAAACSLCQRATRAVKRMLTVSTMLLVMFAGCKSPPPKVTHVPIKSEKLNPRNVIRQRPLAAVVPEVPPSRTNEVSVSIAGESFNTRRILQAKPMIGGSWQTIANRGTNFTLSLPSNMLDTLFRAAAVRTNAVRFAWDVSEMPEPGMFFRIYSGRSSRNYTNWVNLAGTGISGSLTNLPDGTNYIAVTKVVPLSSGEAETSYSNEVVVNVSPLNISPPRPTLGIR